MNYLWPVAAFLLQEGHIVLMSNKVGTTTFSKGYGLKEIKKASLNKLLLNPLQKIHLHLLVRHPLSRVISVYQSKTKKDVEAGSWNQFCQALITDLMDSHASARDVLLQLSLEDFVMNILPQIKEKDHHFKGQASYFRERIPDPCRSYGFRAFRAWNNVFQKIQLDGEDYPSWAASFGLDASVSLNKTESQSTPSAEIITRVEQLYAEDYSIFDYPTISQATEK